MKKKIDIPLIITIFIICIYGIIMIYSASSIWAEYKFNDKFHYLIMQISNKYMKGGNEYEKS